MSWRDLRELGLRLNSTERLLVAQVAEGELLDAASCAAPVRAAVLRRLLMDGPWPADAKGVRLRNARITGLLDLQAVTLRCPLWLQDCTFTDPRPICINFARAPLIVLRGCQLAGLSADSADSSAARVPPSERAGTGSRSPPTACGSAAGPPGDCAWQVSATTDSGVTR